MPLEIVKPTQAPPTLNMLLYGGPGSGKTTGGCSAPGPVLVLEAEPGNPLRFARSVHGDDKIHEVALSGRGVLEDAYLHLKAEASVERTVVVDSLGELYRVVLEEISGGGKPTLPNYGDAGTAVERFCRSLIDLPINVVLIAHEASVKDEEAGHFERLPITGTSNPALGVKLMAMVDVVGYCARVAAERKDDEDRFMAQLVTANGRRGKDRTGSLGKVRELDLEDWIKTAAAALGSKPAGAGRKTKPNERKAA